MRQLMQHQEEAIQFLRTKSYKAGLFLAPGTGKTLIAIRVAKEFLPALVICRRDDFLTWRNELFQERYYKENILCILSENSLKNLTHAWPWTIVTYDLLKNKEIYNYISNKQYGIVFGDESHAIKHWESQRTKVVYAATRHIDKRILMTGSPITNEILDVYSQCLFIDNGETFGTSQWKFRNNYYIQSGPGWYPKKEARSIIAEKLKTISYHVHEDDVLDLPPIRTVIKAVPLTMEQRRYYSKLVTNWEIELKNGKVLDINYIIVRLAKLKQMAAGFFYIEKEPIYIKENKISLLLDLLTDNAYLAKKQKIVIWASYRAEIRRIFHNLEKNGLRTVTYYGNMTTPQKNAARERFRDDPSCRFFIGQVDSGVGMNELVVSDSAVYMSNSFKIVSRQQSERRIRRYGSERHDNITYYDIVAEKTVDFPILKSIKKGMNIAQDILNQIKLGTSIKKLIGY